MGPDDVDTSYLSPAEQVVMDLCLRLVRSEAIQAKDGGNDTVQVVFELLASRHQTWVALETVLESVWPREAMPESERLAAVQIAHEMAGGVWDSGDHRYGAPNAEAWVDIFLELEPASGTFNLDFTDLAEVRRRVVDPVLASLFKDGEIREITVSVGPPHGQSPSYPDDDLEIWILLVDADGDTFVRRLGKATVERWEAESCADDLANALEDWVCETRYGWGEQRIANYRVPAPPRSP